MWSVTTAAELIWPEIALEEQFVCLQECEFLREFLLNMLEGKGGKAVGKRLECFNCSGLGFSKLAEHLKLFRRLKIYRCIA